MTHKIKFDPNVSSLAENDRKYNRVMIEQKKTYINDLLLRERGYVYLNDIYEIFGLKWNPLNENPCCINRGDSARVIFVIEEVIENHFEITIIW